MAKITMQVQSKTISQLINDLESGKYYLPSFQRDYVWDLDDIKNLIDSVTNNYPIGNIILWKPSKVDIDKFSHPLLDTNNKSSERLYVMDGQQRLTSFLLLMRDWKIERDGEPIGFQTPIAYSPVSNKFFKSTKRGINVSKIIKAFCQFDIEELSIILEGKDSNNTRKILQDKFGSLLNYTVPIYLMETYNEDEKTFQEMADAFTRVNKYGVKIRNLDLMLSFLAGSISGKLKNQLYSLYQETDKNFKLDLQPIIRFIFYHCNLKQTKISKLESFTKNLETIQHLGEEELDIIFNNCANALRLTIEFIKKEIKLSNTKLLPSQMPLIVIASFFYNRELSSIEALSKSEIENITNWFILTSFHKHYSSSTDVKLDEDLILLKNVIIFPYDKLIKNIGSNKQDKSRISESDINLGKQKNILHGDGKIYLFILYLILAKNASEDWDSHLIGDLNLTGISKHHIFPKEYLEVNLDSVEDPEEKEILINNLGNITFINQNINASIGDLCPEEYMTDYISVITKHSIPTDKNLWSIDQYKTFLDYRVTQIFKEGRIYFPKIFGNSHNYLKNR